MCLEKIQNDELTPYSTAGTAGRFPGYRTLEQRASAWVAAVSCCALPPALLHEVASFVPLAGARLMVTCRGGLPELFRFERWLRSLAVQHCQKEGRDIQIHNIYEGRRLALRSTCWHLLPWSRRPPPLQISRASGFNDYAELIADALVAGADADLLFALLQMLLVTDERFRRDRDLIGAFKICKYNNNGEYGKTNFTNLLFAALRSEGTDSATSLLVQLGSIRIKKCLTPPLSAGLMTRVMEWSLKCDC